MVDDPVGEGDDHVRNIKACLQRSFSGVDAEVLPTSEQFNKVIMSEQNYDDVVNPDPDDLREPTDIDENIEWHDRNLEARVDGTGFADGRYDPALPPTPLPEDWPNGRNLFQLEERIALLEELYQVPVNHTVFTVNDINPGDPRSGGGYGYGTWIRVGAGQFIAGVGSGTDQNGVVHDVLPGLNAGEYEHELTEAELAEHKHWNGALFRSFWANDTNYPNGYRSRSNSGYSSAEHHEGFGNIEPMTEEAGEGEGHENKPPHLGMYIWRRTA